MRSELSNLLAAYLLGWKTIRDCVEWFAGLDWGDTQLDPQTQDLVAKLELVATEVAEGMRLEKEFWQEAADFVAKETGSVYAIYTLPEGISRSSSSSNIVSQTPVLV